MLINSKLQLLSGEVPEFNDWQVKNEPMLFNCDLGAAWAIGDQITKTFIGMLPESWAKAPLVIDSRVHMLMPGWYPCIPGWHHDDVPRTRSDGQPNYEDIDGNRSEHIMMLVNGDICPTEFALGEQDFEIPGLGRTIYADWHVEVENRLREWEGPEYLLPEDMKLRRFKAPTNRLIKFNDRTWHRGTTAVANGWRFFIRASRYFDSDGKAIPRGNPRTNEVRKQVQVYMAFPDAGW